MSRMTARRWIALVPAVLVLAGLLAPAPLAICSTVERCSMMGAGQPIGAGVGSTCAPRPGFDCCQRGSSPPMAPRDERAVAKLQTAVVPAVGADLDLVLTARTEPEPTAWRVPRGAAPPLYTLLATLLI